MRSPRRSRPRANFAPTSRDIASINTHHGALVASGQQVIDILSASRGDGRLEAIVFVSMASGKRVKPGDEALIAPELAAGRQP